MHKQIARITRLFVAACAIVAASSSHAGLILTAPMNFPGSGLGPANSILTLQSFLGVEAGGVIYNGSSDVTIGGALTGGSQTQTRSLGSLGIGSANDLRIVFDPLEPTNAQSIFLSSLTLNIFSSTGGLLYSSSVLGQNFTNTTTGAGNSGFVFKLDTASALAAQSAAFGSGFANNRIGLIASAVLATGGADTFYAASAGGTGGGGNNVPEPASLALLGIGMLAALRARRRG